MTHDAPSIFEADLPAPEHFDSFHPFIKGVFSQWHPTSFQIDGLTVVTAEQWMMFSKARLFGDDGAANAILATDNPDEQKRFGQNVQGFHQDMGSLESQLRLSGQPRKIQPERGRGPPTQVDRRRHAR
jgi:predicted NAD-dependent protein-ADP-ribosyltransferase YbiA (DUF1768 family)